MTRDGEGSERRPASPQVDPSHYRDAEYLTRERFLSYWHQIQLVKRCDPTSVLEIGIGNRLVADYLERIGVDVKTLDIDVRLGPEVTGSVDALPFGSSCFDVVACFEVLEHLPFPRFRPALSELRRVSRRHVVLSLPDSRGAWRVDVRLPGFGRYRKLIERPRLFGLPQMEASEEHFWEVNREGWPLERIRNRIEQVGFELVKTFRVFEFPYHRFFVLATDND